MTNCRRFLKTLIAITLPLQSSIVATGQGHWSFINQTKRLKKSFEKEINQSKYSNAVHQILKITSSLTDMNFRAKYLNVDQSKVTNGICISLYRKLLQQMG